MSTTVFDARSGLLTADQSIAQAARTWSQPLVDAAAADVRALYVYGSALREDFDPTRSDVNLLLVVKALGQERLDALAAASTRLPKPAVEAIGARYRPLILTEEQLLDSADVFPMDLLDLARRRALLSGEDVLAGITIDRADLRRHCEYELRTKIVGLRQAYLQAGGGPSTAQELTIRAASGAATLYRQLLALAGQGDEGRPEALAEAVGAAYAVPGAALAGPFVARGETSTPADDVLTARFAAFLTALEALIRAVDALAAR
jgi:predicted nucleotidyltransferase